MIEMIHKKRFIIVAYNLHTGGGLVLLKSVLAALSEYHGILLLDERLPTNVEIPSQFNAYKVRPGFLSRFKVERFLKKIQYPDDIILCLGNLPPLFKPRAIVHCCLQHRGLVDRTIRPASLWVRWRTQIERLWLKSFSKHVDQFWVQTPLMADLLKKNIKKPVDIRCAIPGFENIHYSRSLNAKTIMDGQSSFIYPASGETHKNHRSLIEAWKRLAAESIFPTLYLTLSPERDTHLLDWIQQQKEDTSIKVINLGELPHVELLDWYRKMNALIFPSVLESLGFPLLEARQAALPVIASELDFVRDVLDPDETFDPHSSASIARAVKRFLNIKEQPLSLIKTEDFLKYLCNPQS